MDVRDNQGRLVAQIEHLRDGNGNTVSSVTNYSNGRPVIQLLSIRSCQGQVESRTILNGKLLP
jgi:hypothetical protein